MNDSASSAELSRLQQEARAAYSRLQAFQEEVQRQASVAAANALHELVKVNPDPRMSEVLTLLRRHPNLDVGFQRDHGGLGSVFFVGVLMDGRVTLLYGDTFAAAVEQALAHFEKA